MLIHLGGLMRCRLCRYMFGSNAMEAVLIYEGDWGINEMYAV